MYLFILQFLYTASPYISGLDLRYGKREVSRGLHNFCRYIRRFMSGLCASLYLQRHKRSRCRKKRCNPCRLFHCSSSFGRRIYSDRYFRFIAYKTSNHRCNRNYRNITFLSVLQYDKQCNFILSDSRPL